MAYSATVGEGIVRVVLALIAAALLAGCGSDPVRADLESYERTVIRPLAAIEADAAAALGELAGATSRGRLDGRQARDLMRDRMAEPFHTAVSLLETHRPASAPLAALHARLTDEYRALARELDQAADAVAKNDWKKADALLASLGTRGFASVRADVAALASQHGLDEAGQSPSRKPPLSSTSTGRTSMRSLSTLRNTGP